MALYLFIPKKKNGDNLKSIEFEEDINFKTLENKSFSSSFMMKEQGIDIGETFSDHLESNNAEGIIVLFLSSTCLTCIDLFPKLNEFIKKYKNEKIFLYIKGEANEIEEIVFRNKLNIPVVNYNIEDQDKYKVTIFPHYYYLTKDRIVLSKGIISSIEEIENLINKNEFS